MSNDWDLDSNPMENESPRRAPAIWEYTLEDRTRQEIEMPIGAKVLSVGIHGGLVRLWAIVDPSKYPKSDTELRLFETYETGRELSCGPAGDLEFLGTVTVMDGVDDPFSPNFDSGTALHIFERVGPSPSSRFTFSTQ